MSSSEWSPLWWAAASVVVVLLLLWWRQYSQHFKRLGLPYSTPLPLVGNMVQLALRTRSLSDVVRDLYRRHDPHPYVGIFNFTKKVVMLRDPDILRIITVKDFDHFSDHTPIFGSDQGDTLFGKNLFALKGKRWHEVRTTLSPTFTTLKMKNIFVFICEIGQQMLSHLKKMTIDKNGNPLTMEMKDFFTRVGSDVIATTAFGFRVDSLAEPDNEFYRMGLSLTTTKPSITLGYSFCPWLMKLLDIPFFDRKTENFFRSMVSETMKIREAQGIVRKDMLDLLMQVRRGEILSDENEMNDTVNSTKKRLDDEEIASQAMVFFLGGFDTVATMLSFCSYLLATHPDVQRRLQEEVDAVMEKSGGQPSYEQVQGCQYLDMVISEALRMFAPASFIDRQCVRPYKLPAVGTAPAVILQPGDSVWGPAHAFHYDERYFPDPERFYPERFSPDNKSNIKPFTYIPFGCGPRFCIAQRFALLEGKVMLVFFLSQFSFQIISKTKIPPKLESRGLGINLKGGTWLGIVPRDKTRLTAAETVPKKAA